MVFEALALHIPQQPQRDPITEQSVNTQERELYSKSFTAKVDVPVSSTHDTSLVLPFPTDSLERTRQDG